MLKVSVIIPVYNMENFIEKCINSIITQTLNDIELIFIDDGSTDKSVSIIKEYQKDYTNIVLIQQERSGAGLAKNRGIEAANGEYLAFVDPDDYYYSNDALQLLYEKAISNNYLAVCGNELQDMHGKIQRMNGDEYHFEEDGEMIYTDYQFPWGFQRCLFQRKMIIDNHIFFPDYVRGADPVFFVNAMICANKIGIVSKDIYVIRYFDKKLKWENTRVINDNLNCFLDLMKIANRFNYTKLQYYIIEKGLAAYKELIFLHIYYGNEQLYDTLQVMNNLVTNKDLCLSESYYLNYDTETINKYVIQKKYECDLLKNYVLKYSDIIIYGAANIGKSVYDCLEMIIDRDRIKFANSDVAPQGTARGKRIYSINDLASSNNDLLVIIAVRDELYNEMFDKAYELGFKNIYHINSVVYDVDSFEIGEGKFGV